MLTYQGSDMRVPSFDPVEYFASRVAGSFRIEPTPDGGTLITVWRYGELDEVITCASGGEANRARQRLTQEGLAGFVSHAL